MVQPSVGRTVHYTSYGTPGGEYDSECRAAIIAGIPDPRSLAVSRLVEDEVSARQVIELCVLNPRGVFFDMCEHDEDEKRGGTWHWPEKVED
jgi:hypothetical protein